MTLARLLLAGLLVVPVVLQAGEDVEVPTFRFDPTWPKPLPET